MYTALRATSFTIARHLERHFNADPEVSPLFGGGGGMGEFFYIRWRITEIEYNQPPKY
jgi:hypothetical protein